MNFHFSFIFYPSLHRAAYSSGKVMTILEVTVIFSQKLFAVDSYGCVIYGHTKAFTRICTDGGKQNFEFLLIDGFRKLDITVWNREDGLIGCAQAQLGRDISVGYDDILCPVRSQAGELAGEVRLITRLDESFGQESRKGNYQELAAVMTLPEFSQHVPQLSQTFKDWKLKPPTFKCVQCGSTALVGYKSPNCCNTCGHKCETDKEDFFDAINLGMGSFFSLLAFVFKNNPSSLQLLCGPINKDGFPVRLVGMEYDDSGGGQAADHQDPEAGNNIASTPVGYKVQPKCRRCKSSDIFRHFDEYGDLLPRYMCNTCSPSCTEGGTILAEDGSSREKVFSASPVNVNNIFGDGGKDTDLDLEACKQQADEKGKTYENESIKQKMGVGMLSQNKEDVRIKMLSDEITAEQLQLICDLMKQLVEDKKKTDTLNRLNVLSTMVLASSAQGAASLISAGSSAVPWIIAAANAVAFTASLTSICLVGKKPPVSILLSKFGTAALVTVVMGVTYMYLPGYLKWLAGLGCAIPIAAVIYS